MQFNNRFFEDLSVSEPVTELVTEVAMRVAAIARASAPRGETLDYVNGISVETKRQQRAVALVVAHDRKSMLIESKTGNLARALRAVKKGG